MSKKFFYAAFGILGALSLFLYLQHREHLYAVSSYVFFVIFIIFHIFMHAGHGGHDIGKDRKKNGEHHHE